jgi:hypothetical protein
MNASILKNIIKEESEAVARLRENLSADEFTSKVKLNIVSHEDTVRLGIAKTIEDAKLISMSLDKDYEIKWRLHVTYAKYGIWSLSAIIPDQVIKGVLFSREAGETDEEFTVDIPIKDAIIQLENNSDKVHKESLEFWPYEVEFYKNKCIVLFQI